MPEALQTGDPLSSEPVPHSVFSVESVPENERFAVWRESIACIFEVEAERDVRGSAFAASLDAHMLGPLLLARTRTLAQRWTRSPATIARDGMDHYMIQLYESGHMICEHDRGTTDLAPGGLVVFDLSRQVVSRTDNFCNLSLVLPRPMLEGLLTLPDDQHMRVLHANQPMVALLRDHMCSLKRIAGQVGAAQAQELAPATAALAAACLNGSLDDLPLGPGRPTLRETTLVARAKRFIEDNLAHPDLTPARVASATGVSRTRLYDLFEPYGGVAAHIRERRLRRALLVLTDPAAADRPIYDIALDCGFASDATFSRLFRERFGLSPREARSEGFRRVSTAAPAYGVDRRYENWLNRLVV